jgi:peroxiredoxin
MRIALVALPLLALACNGKDRRESPQPDAGVVGSLLEPFSFATSERETLAWNPEGGLRAGAGHGAPAAMILHVFQPDCPACQDEARALAELSAGREGVAVVGLAHRGEPEDLEAFRGVTGARYPLAHAAGTRWAERWSRGDPTYLVDPDGRIVYAQVGFHPSDVAGWNAALDAVLAGRPVDRDGPERPALRAGERMPRIELPDLVTGRTTVIDTRDGELVLERDGEARTFRAAIGFFSRY